MPGTEGLKDSGQDIYTLDTSKSALVVNMETNKLVTYLFVTSVCSAAYILDDNINTLTPSHETSVSEKQTSLLPAKTRSKQPFPLNNINGCNEKSDDKGPLNSLLGGLLPSLLSILSKNHNSPSGNNNCENGQRNFKYTQHTFKTNSEGVNEKPLDSILDMDNHDANEINSDDLEENVQPYNSVSDVDADTDVLNGDDSEENARPNNSPSDVDADTDVLNGEQLKNKDMLENPFKILEKSKETQEEYFTGKTLIATVVDSMSRQNVNLRSCETCKENDGERTRRQGPLVDADVNILNGDDNENNSDEEESSETQAPLVDVDVNALNGGQSSLTDTLGGILKHKKGDDNTGERNNESLLEKTKTMRKEEPNKDYSEERSILQQNNLEKYKHYYIQTPNKNKLEITGRERNMHHKTVESDEEEFYQARITQNEDKNDDDEEENVINKNKLKKLKSTNFEAFITDNEEHQSLEIPTLASNIYEKGKQSIHSDESGIGDEFTKRVKTKNNLEIHKINYNDNQLKTLISSQPMLSAGEKSYFAYTNQHFGNMNNGYERVSKRFWPFINKNQPFPGTNAFSKTPLEWNIEYQNLYYVPPRNNIAYRAGTQSKRNPLFKIVSQLEYPIISQYPQSVAGSNLYGSYAIAQTMPDNKYGNNGLVGGTGLPVGGQTSVEETQTSVEQVSSSQEGVGASQMGVIGGPI